MIKESAKKEAKTDERDWQREKQSIGERGWCKHTGNNVEGRKDRENTKTKREKNSLQGKRRWRYIYRNISCEKWIAHSFFASFVFHPSRSEYLFPPTSADSRQLPPIPADLRMPPVSSYVLYTATEQPTERVTVEKHSLVRCIWQILYIY